MGGPGRYDLSHLIPTASSLGFEGHWLVYVGEEVGGTEVRNGVLQVIDIVFPNLPRPGHPTGGTQPGTREQFQTRGWRAGVRATSRALRSCVQRHRDVNAADGAAASALPREDGRARGEAELCGDPGAEGAGGSHRFRRAGDASRARGPASYYRKCNSARGFALWHVRQSLVVKEHLKECVVSPPKREAPPDFS